MSESTAGWLWILVGLVALAAEVVLPSFFIIFAALAAPIPAILGFMGVSLTWQLLAFSTALTLLLIFVRPIYVKKIRGGKETLPSRAEVLLGKTGVVTTALDPARGEGRIQIEGEDWAARSTVPLSLGTSIRVTGCDGIVLLVEPIPSPKAPLQ